MKPNPYFPGAGAAPAYIAGRDEDIENAKEELETISYGYPARSVIYYGLRGVGKTVLLNKVESIAKALMIPEEYMEIPEHGKNNFQSELALSVYKLMKQLSVKEQLESYVKRALGILKSFSIKYSQGDFATEIAVDPIQGLANTGNISNDMTELFLALGEVAKQNKKGVAFFIDEIQYLDQVDLEGLIRALHRSNQKGYPIIIYAAGLPKIAKFVGVAKSYAERLFSFVEIDSLDAIAAEKALVYPAKEMGVAYTPKAINHILSTTEGYPYFIQEYGKWIWKHRHNSDIITDEIAIAAYNDFEKSLDSGFFRVRYDKATTKELDFMLAMVECGELPCTIKNVAEILGVTQQRISAVRAQLIHKGFIYAANYGKLDFTVPQFGQYLRRQQGNIR